MLSINTNLSSLITQSSLNNSTDLLNLAIERMTTGFKINHAKDNAANFSIIDDLNKRISSMLQVQNNAEDGISMLLTAEGGLEEIQGLLERLRELTIQASNDTCDSKTRTAIQAEADAIVEEINRLKSSVEYNGMNLYETPARGNLNNPVVNLAQAARISLTTDAGDIMSNDTFALNPVSLMNVGDDLSSSPTSFSEGGNEISPSQPSPSREGVGVNEEVNNTSSNASLPMARTMMRSASPASTLLSGAADIASGATQTVVIDGVEYTVKNKLSSVNSLSWTKDTSTGEVTLLGSNFTITSQTNVSHNLIIRGSSNTVYGGDLADTIKINDASSTNNYIYGGAGDDTIITTTQISEFEIYGEDGNDTIEIAGVNFGALYGGNGNDKIYLKNNYSPHSFLVNGDDGDDYFEVNWSNVTVNGGAGEDEFNVTNLSKNAKINGGEGTNSIIDNGTNTVKTNVPGATSYSVSFAANETKTLNINGINYEVTNNKSSAADLVYSITDTGQIKFTSSYFTIKGEANKQHNIFINGSSIVFYGGNLADTITVNKTESSVYAGEGNDIINLNQGYGFVYGGAGDDIVNIKNTVFNSTIYLEEGNDTINTNNYKFSGSLLSLGEGNDSIVGNSTYTSVGIDGGVGTNTIGESSIFTNTLISGFNPDIDNAQTISINKSATVNLDIDGVNYQITEQGYGDTTLLYAKDPVTNMVTFAGKKLTIKGQTDVSHNVTLYGAYLNFYGGELEDIVTVHSGGGYIYGNGGNDSMTVYRSDSLLYGGEGNDTLIANGNSALYGQAGDDTLIINATGTYAANGGDGNDTYQVNASRTLNDTGGNNVYYINTDGATISGAKDNDTFYVAGNNNIINGVAGDDYFEVTGTGNELHGGTGTSNFVIDAVGNTISANDTSNVIISVPVSECTIQTPDKITVIDTPTIKFTDSNEVTRNINGLNYKFTNLYGDINNIVTYTINENTGLVVFTGSNVQVDCIDNSNYNFSIRGNNNIVNGGNQADKITVESGSGNVINGLGGADTLINQSENNSFNGGAGNDTITLTKKATAVNGGDGNDTINVNSDNNGTIDSGSGNDVLNVTGSNNTDIVTNDGNNTINVSGANNEVVSGDGNNKYVITGTNNTLVGGNGLNSVGVSGSNNTLTVENANGNLNVYGRDNNVTVGIDATTFALNRAATGTINKVNIDGTGNVVNQYISQSEVTIKGSANTYNSNVGQQDVTVNGNGNTINTSDGNDTISIKGDANTVTTTGGNNELEIKGDSNQVLGGAGKDKVKLTGSSNTILGGDGNDEFTLVSGSNNTIDGEGGDRNTMINYANSTNSSNLYDITPRPFELSLKIGIGYDESSVINTSISFNPIFLEVDLSSRESALESLASIEDCLKSVNEQLLSIGSVINRLQLVLEEQSIKLENMISTRSTLRDADIAEVSSQYIQQQILQQASATLMATANQTPSIALGLI